MRKVLTFVFVLLISYSYADSPITSTSFYYAYLDVEIVNKAANGNGEIQEDEMIFLSSKDNPIDYKMALINALGWKFEGKSNYNKYLSFLEKKYSVSKTEKKFFRKISADECLSLAYLLALDDYFDVKEALSLAERSVDKEKGKSYTYQIIYGLIKAQSLFNEDWCLLWKATDNVRQNTSLEQDIRGEAIDIIFDYMDLYKVECSE